MENVNTSRACARFVRISVRKMNQVADVVRRKPAEEALTVLRFVPKKGAKILYKIIKSAVSNAEMNHDMSADTLVVDEIHVEQGPTMKRFRPCPMGRASKIRKKTSHTTVILKEDLRLAEKPSRPRKVDEETAETADKAETKEAAAKPKATKAKSAKAKTTKAKTEKAVTEKKAAAPKKTQTAAKKSSEPKAEKPKATKKAKAETEE